MDSERFCRWNSLPKKLRIYPKNAAIGLPDGSILITGGLIYHKKGISILSKSFKFNPFSKVCYQTGPLTTPRFNHQMVNFNDRILCIGGSQKYGAKKQAMSVEIFDQKLEVWRPFGSLENVLKVGESIKVLMHDRKLHVIDLSKDQKTIHTMVRYSVKEKNFIPLDNPSP